MTTLQTMAGYDEMQKEIKRLRGEIAEATGIIDDIIPLHSVCVAADAWLTRNKA